MLDKINACEFYISDWDLYRPHVGSISKIANEFPGEYKLLIKSYQNPDGLCFALSNVDVFSPDFEQKLIHWREEHNYKIFRIGLTESRTDRSSLLYLKGILKKYFGHDKVYLKILDEDKTLELKEIRVDSSNPSLHKELFRFLDIEEDDAPF